jgi:3,4-dihydroxy 2-butanone 4-phosphate synthase/GTP cyclohydrolase II
MDTGLTITPIEELIEEARNGRMYILVDDEDRENEGDLIIPAQMATPEAINFMATHGRGLICLAMTEARVAELGLPMMCNVNRDSEQTAFTVSIEASKGVTTGISAGDRSLTVAAAIGAGNGPEAIVSPGHVFPLAARTGGVLVRAGHTEAAVDISRLSGLNPSGVICEIMNDDGTMARLSDLLPFAKQHGLKIGTIRDLIAFRLQQNDHNVEKIAEFEFESRWGGKWNSISFRNKAIDKENLVLIKGQIDGTKPTMVRMHGFETFADALGSKDGRSGLLQQAMERIGDEGTGVIVLLARRTPGKPSLAMAPVSTPSEEDAMPELRDYGVGAQILVALGIRDMILLVHSHKTLVGLQGYGLNIVGEEWIESIN